MTLPRVTVNTPSVEQRILVDAINKALSEYSTQIDLINDQHLNVKFFGARGDGITDDTAAIKLAIETAHLSTTGYKIYLPPGTYIISPSGAFIFHLYDDLAFFGAGPTQTILKVRNKSPNYRAVFGSDQAFRIHFSDFKIDQNPEGNQTCTVSGQNPHQVVTVHGDHFTVHNMFFRGIGTQCLSFIQDDISVPMAARVLASYFEFIKTGTDKTYDNSMVYFEGPEHVAIGNHFYTEDYYTDITLDAIGAIESHGGHSTIIGNTCSGFEAFVNIEPSDVWHEDLEVSNIVICCNSIEKTANGIAIFANSAVDRGTLRSVDISHNTISINNADRLLNNYGCGITTYFMTASGAVDGLKITENTIVFQEDSPRVWQFWDLSAGVLLWTYGSLSNVDVSGNTIIRAPFSGIVCKPVISGGSTPAFNRISIRNNKIIDAGSNTYDAGGTTLAYRTGIFVYGNDASYPAINVSVIDNDIFDTHGASPVTVFSYYIVGSTSYPVKVRVGERSSNLRALGSYMVGVKLVEIDDFATYSYAANIYPNLMLGKAHHITHAAGETSSITIGAPTTGGYAPTLAAGHQMSIRIKNASGSAVTDSFTSSVYKMASWGSLADGCSRSVVLEWDGTNWIEISRSGDITH
jgi:hypothetical protein